MSSPGSPVESENGWDWKSCDEGRLDYYVQALQLLGIELSQALPARVREEAITPLNETPRSNIIIGHFERTPTKERLLNHSCKTVSVVQHIVSKRIAHNYPPIIDMGVQPRIKNFWCLHCVLSFKAFQSRKPSKQELQIVLDSFNAQFQAP